MFFLHFLAIIFTFFCFDFLFFNVLLHEFVSSIDAQMLDVKDTIVKLVV